MEWRWPLFYVSGRGLLGRSLDPSRLGLACLCRHNEEIAPPPYRSHHSLPRDNVVVLYPRQDPDLEGRARKRARVGLGSSAPPTKAGRRHPNCVAGRARKVRNRKGNRLKDKSLQRPKQNKSPSPRKGLESYGIHRGGVHNDKTPGRRSSLL